MQFLPTGAQISNDSLIESTRTSGNSSVMTLTNGSIILNNATVAISRGYFDSGTFDITAFDGNKNRLMIWLSHPAEMFDSMGLTMKRWKGGKSFKNLHMII